MSNFKKLSIFALILILIGFVGILLTYDKSNLNRSISILPSKIPIFLDDETTEENSLLDERSINEAFNSISINSSNINIEIIPSDTASTKLSFTGSSSTKYTLDSSVKGDTLNVEVKQKSQSSFFSGFNKSNLKLKMYVPKKDYEEVYIDNSNGKIEVDDFKINNINIESGNGGIYLNNINAVSVSLNSSNGEIIFQGNVTGDIKGSSSNGQIKLTLPTINFPVDLDASNGLLSIKVDKEPENVTYNVNASNGTVNIFNKYADGSVIGDGSNLIKLEASNGVIKVSK
jgi:DUF4097 and DUF4098 domain-containing protein YvlB